MWKIREFQDRVTNIVFNYTEAEALVREATNEDPWGPTGPQMKELAKLTFAYEVYQEVMQMLWKRMLVDPQKSWRRVYKSLLLLSYLLRNGSERVVTSTREHTYDMKSLRNYHFIDENGKDQGVNVRQKAKELIEFAHDDDRLRDERRKSRKTKDKFVSISSDTYGGGGYGERYDESPHHYSSTTYGTRDVSPEKNFHDDPSPMPSNDTNRNSPMPLENLPQSRNSLSLDSTKLKLPTGGAKSMNGNSNPKSQPDLLNIDESNGAVNNDFGGFNWAAPVDSVRSHDDFGGFVNAMDSAPQTSTAPAPLMSNSQSLMDFAHFNQNSNSSRQKQTPANDQMFANFKSHEQPQNHNISLFDSQPENVNPYNLIQPSINPVSSPLLMESPAFSSSNQPVTNSANGNFAHFSQQSAFPVPQTSGNVPLSPLQPQAPLQPLSSNHAQPFQTTGPATAPASSKNISTNSSVSSTAAVGSTWSGANVNIDLSDLHMSPSRSGRPSNSPSLNSLKMAGNANASNNPAPTSFNNNSATNFFPTQPNNSSRPFNSPMMIPTPVSQQ